MSAQRIVAYINRGLLTVNQAEHGLEQARLCREAADDFARALRLLREDFPKVLRIAEVLFRYETALEGMISRLREKAKAFDAVTELEPRRTPCR